MFKRRNSLQHQMQFLLKAIETNFNIDTTPFLICKQMLNYKLNLPSGIEYKY